MTTENAPARLENVSAQLVGVIEKIFPTERVGQGGMYQKKFWLSEAKSQRHPYPQSWECVLWHEDTEDLNEFKEGDPVRVTLEVRGKDWKKKDGQEIKIHMLRAYKIEKLEPKDVL